MDECYSQYICIERNEPENDFEKEMTTHESQSDHVYEGKWATLEFQVWAMVTVTLVALR